MASLANLIELNKKWLLNEVHHHPEFVSPSPGENNLDPETDEILDHLLKLNDCGFYTTSSQPYYRDKDCQQVPWVYGYVSTYGFQSLVDQTCESPNPKICFSWDEECKHDPTDFIVTKLYLNQNSVDNVLSWGGHIPKDRMQYTYGCQCKREANPCRPHCTQPLVEIAIHSIQWEEEDKEFWPLLVKLFQ